MLDPKQWDIEEEKCKKYVLIKSKMKDSKTRMD
jgi:hypothetical protein